jgi:hypothetical protein
MERPGAALGISIDLPHKVIYYHAMTFEEAEAVEQAEIRQERRRENLK